MHVGLEARNPVPGSANHEDRLTIPCGVIDEVPFANERRQLRDTGYVLLPRFGAGALVGLLETLGRVLHVEEVVVDPTSASLVKSTEGLSLHTDHHRAQFIVWHCIAQSDEGGVTVLADGLAAYLSLSHGHRAALTGVLLQEHSVFRGDREQHPLVTMRDGSLRLYYSYWLAQGEITEAARAALNAFEAAVRSAHHVELRLEPGDVLAIDNGRMLHGRTPISGSKSRHLRRYWIEAGASPG